MKPKENEFQMNVPTIGMFDGGTQPPVYYDKKGNKIPYKKTKWYKLAKKKRGEHV